MRLPLFMSAPLVQLLHPKNDGAPEIEKNFRPRTIGSLTEPCFGLDIPHVGKVAIVDAIHDDSVELEALGAVQVHIDMNFHGSARYLRFAIGKHAEEADCFSG